MQITIFTAGSQGDVQPAVLLGKSLQQAGFGVLMAAPENFADYVQSHGLPFHPLRGDVQQIMASDTGRQFMEKGGANPIRSMLAMRKMLGPIAIQMAEDALEACREADALISLAVFAPFGKTIAEIKGIPLINIEPTPLLPTGDFPAPGWPVQQDFGRLLNRFSGFGMLQMIWQWYGPFVNQFRKGYGLPPYQSSSFYRILASTPLIGAYSPSLIPHPTDWPRSMHITGYWFQDSQPGWQPSSALKAFLEDGPPPVYVGFGSMGGRSPQTLAGIVVEALAISGQRGLLLTGWGGMEVMEMPENVFVVNASPHGWLFPRMRAVVHHGGAGTTAEGLRAGVPAVIIPFIVDQPFWGKRTKELGVSPNPIPARKLTAEMLARAIRAATQDEKMRERAAALGKAVQAEDGLGSAVKTIQQYLGR